MGRAYSKNNALYFQHDTFMRVDPKVLALDRKYGYHLGYAHWCVLLELIANADNFELSMSAGDIPLHASEFGMTCDEFKEFIQECKKLKLIEVKKSTIRCAKLEIRMQSLLKNRKRSLDYYNKKKNEVALSAENKEVEDDILTSNERQTNVKNQQNRIEENRIEENRIEENRIEEKTQRESASAQEDDDDDFYKPKILEPDTLKVEPFVPPTVDEVRKFAAWQHLPNFDAEKFLKYYNAIEWKTTEGIQIQNWKKFAYLWSDREQVIQEKRNKNLSKDERAEQERIKREKRYADFVHDKVNRPDDDDVPEQIW